jgi:hypothetical protein
MQAVAPCGVPASSARAGAAAASGNAQVRDRAGAVRWLP